MTIKFPKVRGERIIIAALLMILAAEIGKAIWPMTPTDSESADAIRIYIDQKRLLAVSSG